MCSTLLINVAPVTANLRRTLRLLLQMDLTPMTTIIQSNDVFMGAIISDRAGFPIGKSMGLWGTPGWALASLRAKDAVRSVTHRLFTDNSHFVPFLPALRRPVAAVFDKEPSNPADPGLKLNRLAGLRKHLLFTELPRLYSKAMMNLRDEERILELAAQQAASWSSDQITMEDLHRLDRTVKGLVIEQFVQVLQHQLPRMQFPADFIVAEDEHHTSRRHELEARLSKLQKAMNTIEGLV